MAKNTTSTPTTDLDSHAAEIVENALLSTTDPMMEKVKAYYAAQQIEYARRMAEIEVFLGFVESAEGLGRRLERVEQFIGIKAE